MGGDEFVIILNDLNHQNDSGIVAKNLLEAFAKAFILSEVICCIGISIGISIFPVNAENAQQLISYADTAMYEVKRSGGNNFGYSPEFES